MMPSGLAGQTRSAEAGSARLVAFLNEPREPELGEVFQLDVRVRVAPGVVAFLSDTLVEAESSVSAGPGTWTVTVGPADSVEVRASYPVMGFLPGGVELPWVELWTKPAEGDETPGVRPAREHTEPFDSTVFEHALLYLGGVFIMPPSGMVGDDAELVPRPPADVVGGERSPALVAAVALLAVAGAALAWLLLAGRVGTGAEPPVVLPPRDEALRELDRIRALGWHTNGRVTDFYDATTGVLRHYAERREPSRWRSALTSSELLAGMRQRWGAEATEPLGPAVWTAECVKFGSERPGPDAAEADWAVIRDWIAGTTEDA